MSIICLDTNILIWGIKKQPTKGQEANVEYAERFIQDIGDKGHTVIIPTIVLAELLANVPFKDHDKIISEIQTFARLEPFDSDASVKYSELFLKLEKTGEEEYKKEFNKSRRALKADIMIIATAICKNVKELYTNNVNEFIKLSSGQKIKILDLPKIPIQTNLDFPQKKYI
ncbi:MAG: type II toxin-antitoxin system VapC family toxin [Leptospiraceae bacterium]|nr:type II toxin-antitoxin system VapC family toxin [Leptospiraceae bacterium]